MTWWFFFNTVVNTAENMFEMSNVTLFPDDYDLWDNTTQVLAGCNTFTSNWSHDGTPLYLRNVPRNVLRRSPKTLHLERLFAIHPMRGMSASCRSDMFTDSHTISKASSTPTRYGSLSEVYAVSKQYAVSKSKSSSTVLHPVPSATVSFYEHPNGIVIR